MLEDVHGRLLRTGKGRKFEMHGERHRQCETGSRDVLMSDSPLVYRPSFRELPATALQVTNVCCIAISERPPVSRL